MSARIVSVSGGMDHVVQFSGGAGSWAAARRVVERYGPGDVTLLCADTRSEHVDWRAFVDAAAAELGARLVMLDGGRDIWELAREQHMIPNTMADFCSRILKREPTVEWLDATCDKATTIVYLGFDYTEDHRLEATLAHQEGWQCEMPLMWEPLADKADILAELEASELPFPAAYRLGLPHNNCLTFGCVKGGQGYWERLLRLLPASYARAETEEESFRAEFGDYSILRDRRSGETKPLPLRVFRERLQRQPSLFDADDHGTCACF